MKKIYHLGNCTTCQAIIKDTAIDKKGFAMQEMLDKCKLKLLEIGFSRNYELRCADLSEGIKIENASVVVLCLTLHNWRK